MAVTKEDVVEFIAGMSVLELSEFIKELEEKFGVSAAAPVAVAAAGAGPADAGAAPAEEQTEFDAVLAGIGDQKIKVIKEAMRRINLIFPAIKNLEDLELEAERWKSIAAAAKPTPTAQYQALIDTFTVAKDAIANQTPYDSVVWP